MRHSISHNGFPHSLKMISVLLDIRRFSTGWLRMMLDVLLSMLRACVIDASRWHNYLPTP